MAKILVLAVLSAVYPTLVALAILMLARPQPVKLFSGFLIGGMAVSLLAGFGILAYADTSALDAGSSGPTRPLLSLVVGLCLIAVAVILLSGRDLPLAERRARRRAARDETEAGGEPKESKVARIVARDSFWLAMAAGALLSLPSVWYLSALAEIDAKDFAVPATILVVLGFNAIMFALIEICLAFCLFAPERAAAGVARFDAWTNSHMREIGIAVAALGGLYLSVRAIISLI
jgi:formate/nitrite transporter FocA (FNT family)